MYDEGDQEGIVPASSGIPPIVVQAAIACIILVFVVAGMVLGTSGHGHMWPAANTLRLKL